MVRPNEVTAQHSLGFKGPLQRDSSCPSFIIISLGSLDLFVLFQSDVLKLNLLNRIK